MSSPQDEPPSPHIPDETDDSPSKGPNLVVIYSLVALSLVAAIVIAILIVLPFYNRR